ncbi:MAG TPA: M23 family metallopeptidase [Actinomycetota bacterium]|jgi:murein DD-endopeptidase MepM/ murein hydrolase activator NlpD|nr:M23 family metallopeptidase [Actinomycetota bacterium]
MRALAAVLIALTLAGPAQAQTPQPAPRPGASHAVPLYGEVVRVYDAPDDPFAPGHRGIDVAAPPGSPVRASATGVVSFAGSVAGNRTVTVDHGGGLLTTYSFLGEVRTVRGTPVERGEIVGAVGSGHPGSTLAPHVHLSARQDGFYFDPLGMYVGDDYSDLLSLTK